MTLTREAKLRRAPREVVYPDSDGKPMAESDTHRDGMMDLIHMLQDRYADRTDVYVSGNLLIYYVEGDPRRRFAPDTFVVFGAPKHRRRIYKLWEEGRPPDVIFELTSRGTRWKDISWKKDLYTRLGIREYYLFDPEREYLHPPLQGFHLVKGAYVPVVAELDGSLVSPRLGLRLLGEGRELRLYDTATGERLLAPHEMSAARKAERAARDAEQTARAAAEAEIARLHAEIHQLRRENSGTAPEQG